MENRMIQEYSIGRFTLLPHRQLFCGGSAVAIRRKVLDLLSVLAMAEGMLVTKEELMTAIWPGAIVEDNALQVHIASLRKLLDSDADLLSTVHGLGYRLPATRLATKRDQAVRTLSVADQATLRLSELMRSGDEIVSLLASQALTNLLNTNRHNSSNKSFRIRRTLNSIKH
jgi:DNA-binding winged helix-turn-helix (wHTH) protein